MHCCRYHFTQILTHNVLHFRSLWALTLPCALYSSFSAQDQVWATLPASSILAFFLFGVDELAMQLEEPFSILPMNYFCQDILESAEILIEIAEEQEQDQVQVAKCV